MLKTSSEQQRKKTIFAYFAIFSPFLSGSMSHNWCTLPTYVKCYERDCVQLESNITNTFPSCWYLRLSDVIQYMLKKIPISLLSTDKKRVKNVHFLEMVFSHFVLFVRVCWALFAYPFSIEIKYAEVYLYKQTHFVSDGIVTTKKTTEVFSSFSKHFAATHGIQSSVLCILLLFLFLHLFVSNTK